MRGAMRLRKILNGRFYSVQSKWQSWAVNQWRLIVAQRLGGGGGRKKIPKKNPPWQQAIGEKIGQENRILGKKKKQTKNTKTS